jgi:hypothetical protein
MRSPPSILNPRQCERAYYRLVDSDISPIWTTDPNSYLDPQSEQITDMLTVDISRSDLNYLIDLEREHRLACRDPRVRAVWEQYQMMLKLTANQD